VIGQGYVGLNIAIAAAENGHIVFGIDNNNSVVENLYKGFTDESGIRSKKLLKLLQNKKYTPTTNSHFIVQSDVIVIAVPTPLDLNRRPDLNYLENASQLIGMHAKEGALVVNESTSYPGTLRNFIKPEIEKINNNKLLYASAPERIDPGNKKWNLRNTPRVIAGLTDDATERAVDFYLSFCQSIYRANSAEVAEASKLIENTYRQVNIALANEFSEIAYQLGFSATDAIAAASTKPFGFEAFYPGIGVGGHCIPVDPSYLTYAVELLGGKTDFIDLANKINLKAHVKIIDRIENSILGSLKGLKVQVAGISYKPNVADLRESPALLLMLELKKRGAVVTWHDPLVGKFNYTNSEELRDDIDLGLILNPHDSIDFTIWKQSKIKVLDLSASLSSYGWPKFL